MELETTLLSDINQAEALKRIPVIIFLAILAIFGLIGNLHVWYIYKGYFISSPYRVFILSMAMIDMVCCCVSIPFEIVDELFPLAYMEMISCKFFRFISTCVAVASVFMLLVIAWERYLKICRPDEHYMTDSSAMFWSVSVLIASVVFTFPAIYVYGRKTINSIEIPGNHGFNTSNPSVTGYECTWGEHMEDTLYFKFYHVWILLTIIGSMTAVVVIYILIWGTLRRNENLTRMFLECPTRTPSIVPETAKEVLKAGNGILPEITKSLPAAPNNTPSSSEKCENGNHIVNGSKTSKGKIIPEKDVGETNSNGETSVADVPAQKCQDQLSIKIDQSTLKVDSSMVQCSKIDYNLRELWENRKMSLESDFSAKAQLLKAQLRLATTINDTELPVTKVMFAVTMLFICCCVPYIVCLLFYLSNFSYTANMTTVELMIYLIGFRLYLVNSAVKAFVYWALDKDYRKQLVRLYRSVFTGCKTIASQNSK